jgi:hypothetical protein
MVESEHEFCRGRTQSAGDTAIFRSWRLVSQTHSVPRRKVGFGAKPTLEGITNAIVKCLTAYYECKTKFGSYNRPLGDKAGEVEIFKITLFAHPNVD